MAVGVRSHFHRDSSLRVRGACSFLSTRTHNGVIMASVCQLHGNSLEFRVTRVEISARIPPPKTHPNSCIPLLFRDRISSVESAAPRALPLRPFNRDFTSRPHDEAKTTKIPMSDETQPGRVLRKRQAQISYSEKDEFDLEDLLEGERCPRHPAMVCPFLTLAANYSSLPAQSTSNTA